MLKLILTQFGLLDRHLCPRLKHIVCSNPHNFYLPFQQKLRFRSLGNYTNTADQNQRIELTQEKQSLITSDLSAQVTWDLFYRKNINNKIDWFVNAQEVVDRIAKILTHSKTVSPPLTLIDAGCGTSQVFPMLLGAVNVPLDLRCVDFSPDAIKALSKVDTKGESASLISFVVADLMKLPFESQSVDLILDKGSTDAMLRRGFRVSDKNNPDQTSPFFNTWHEFWRILRPNQLGVILHISDEDPDVRLGLLDSVLNNFQFSYTIDVDLLEADCNSQEIFFYQIKKVES